MYTQTIFQAGNSQVVAMPSDFLHDLDLKKGQKVVVDKIDDAIVIKKSRPQKLKPKSEAGFQKWLKVFMAENSEILDELADRWYRGSVPHPRNNY